MPFTFKDVIFPMARPTEKALKFITGQTAKERAQARLDERIGRVTEDVGSGFRQAREGLDTMYGNIREGVKPYQAQLRADTERGFARGWHKTGRAAHAGFPWEPLPGRCC